MKKAPCLLVVCSLLLLARPLGSAEGPSGPLTLAERQRIEQVIERINEVFLRVRDAAADLTLDASLHVFGCSGLNRFQGKGYYKATDRLRATLNGETYFVQGNRIRKIDRQGKKWYVQIHNAPDLSPGLNASIIPFNFALRLLRDDEQNIVLEGTPKPGVLKNVTKVIFHVDPRAYLLRRLDLKLVNERLNGSIDLEYQEIDGLPVPVGFRGRSAVELRLGILVGLDISLRGENMKINTGLADQLFEPGF